MRPRIGITTSTHMREQEGASIPASVVNLVYGQSLVRAGAIPLQLPNALGPEDAAEVLSSLDGLVLSGGGDVDPAHWGEAPHPKLGHVDPVRDALEMALLREALRRDLPVLGICRGIQLMAAALGGDLWQDIPAQCGTDICHYQRAARADTFHAVRLVADSPLARIYGLRPDAEGACVLRVNSFHHQAVRAPGPALIPIGWTADNLIEAAALPAAAFVLGVQWHPEDLAADDPRQARLFAAFVQVAAARLV